MAPVKANLVPRHLWKARTYEITEHDAYQAPMVSWGTELLDLDADALLRGQDSRANVTDRKQAKSLIQELLEGGPQPAKVMESERKTADISPRIWKAAKKELGLVSERERDARGFGTERWLWRLPAEFTENAVVIHMEGRRFEE